MYHYTVIYVELFTNYCLWRKYVKYMFYKAQLCNSIALYGMSHKFLRKNYETALNFSNILTCHVSSTNSFIPFYISWKRKVK